MSGDQAGLADEGYAAWIAELKEYLLQAGVHNRPAALVGDASLLSEATLRDVGALLTGGSELRHSQLHQPLVSGTARVRMRPNGALAYAPAQMVLLLLPCHDQLRHCRDRGLHAA